MNRKFRVGILGATGMVGQRFVTLLDGHPWFETVLLAASSRSAGLSYREAVGDRWRIDVPMPAALAEYRVHDVQDTAGISKEVDLVFCALDLDKAATLALEDAYAAAEVVVVSNNSAHRWTSDVPMIIPEVNPDHLALVEAQRARTGYRRGCIVVKPNCSIQSYVPALAALREFLPESLFVTTYQAISGSGKTLATAPEIVDNVIPLPGEEEKSEREPLRIFGSCNGSSISEATIAISAHCNRVPCEDGHLAVVSAKFKIQPTRDEVLKAWGEWLPEPQRLKLPSAPVNCLVYQESLDRPQTRLDRGAGKGMAITLGRLRPCPLLDLRFMALSHNTIRGAAGGAILTAELMAARGMLE